MRTNQMRNYALMTLLFLGYQCFTYAQAPLGDDYFGELDKKINVPNSPEAEAFAKYGNTAVSLYTGTPNISVPIHTFQGKEVSLPMTLSYDASGIKINQQATGAGLGWNLNVGGRVSRMESGKPDDYITANPSYYTIHSNSSPDGVQLPVNQRILNYLDENIKFDSKQDAIDYFTFIDRANVNHVDIQPDYYSFNALGLNETFVFDLATLTPKALNNPRITAEATFSANGLSIDKWKIIAEDGTEFYFELAEVTRRQGNDYGGDGSQSPELYGIDSRYNSSWVLTKIISPNAVDTYTFIYEDLGTHTEELLAPHVKHVTNVLNSNNPIGSQSESYFAPIFNIEKLALKEIKYNNVTVATIDLKSRNDMEAPSAIDKVKVFDPVNGNELRNYTLNHSYFLANQWVDITDQSPLNRLNMRLKLDEVIIASANNATYQKYSFEYHGNGTLTKRGAMSQDYLGYDNGVGNTVLYSSFSSGNLNLPGANRDPNETRAMRGTLSKITYPTGGHTTFDYELHDVSKTVVIPGNYVSDAYLQVQTGSDPSNASQCNGCCMDANYYQPPNIETNVFTVDQTGLYNINCITQHQDGIVTSYGEAFLIKLSDETSGCNTPLEYDEIIGSSCVGLIDDQIIWHSNLNVNEDFNLTLTEGCYQAIIIRGTDGAGNANISTSTLNVRHELPDSTNLINEEKAGIRVSDIKDYTDENTLASHKKYLYKKRMGEFESSGVALWEPNFYEIKKQKFWNSVGTNTTPAGMNEREILNRGISWSKGEKAHVVYGTVYEVQKSASNPFQAHPNGYVQHDFNVGASGLDVTGKNSQAVFYRPNYEAGKPSKTRVYDEQRTVLKENIETYTDEIYFGDSSMYLERSDEFIYHFVLIFRDPVSYKFRYRYVPAEFRCIDSGTLGISCAEVSAPANRPDICFTNVETVCLDWDTYGGYYFNLTYSQGRTLKEQTSINKDYFDGNITQTSSTYKYDSTRDYLLTETQTTDSRGDVIKNELFYPQDYPADSEMTALINDHQKGMIVGTKRYKNNSLLFNRKNNYENKYLKSVETAKADNALEEQMEIDSYDHKGNVLQYHNSKSEVSGQGIVATSFIWGYNYQYPIVKASNVTYTELVAALPTSVSVGSLQTMDETTLRATLEELRNALPQAHITTYTYQPGVGVTSITDPRGYTNYYTYDQFHRLQYVKDADGNLVGKNEYNYRNQ